MKPPANVLAGVLVSILAATAAAEMRAQPAYPTQPMRIIVPFPPAGGGDLLARLYATRMSETWLQPVAIDNRPGANGTVGSALAATAAPDGHTLLMGGIGPQAMAVGLYPKLGYDPLRAFEPVSLVARQQRLLVVHPSLPVKSLQAFVALARARPGTIAYASPGHASVEHVALAHLAQALGIDLLHRPYADETALTRGLLEGAVEAALPVAMRPLNDIRAGRLRVLAAGGVRRAPLAPEIPTLAELGHRADLDAWYGLYAPAGTPPPVLDRLTAEAVRIAGLPDVRERAARDALEMIGGSAEALRAHTAAQIAHWSKIIRAAGINAE